MRQSRSVAAGWVAGLAALLVAVAAWATTVGSSTVGAADVVGIVLAEYDLLAYDAGVPNADAIVWRLRLPRVALGAAVGVALASAGTVMQGFFRNPMADPSIIGVSTGATAGVVAFIATPLGAAATSTCLPAGPLGTYCGSQPMAAVAGGLVTAFAVYLVATRGGHTPVATLLLAGVAVQTFLGAVVSYLMISSRDRSLRDAVGWLVGSLNVENLTFGKVGAVALVTLAGFAVLQLYARDLNVLLQGEAQATAMGVEVERTKRLLLAVSTVVTAAGVMFVGVIGFVGLIVPHVMRLLVGPDHRLLLPTSALAGGSFLVLADAVARWGPVTVPVGIVTAFVGAPFFLYLLRDREVAAL